MQKGVRLKEMIFTTVATKKTIKVKIQLRKITLSLRNFQFRSRTINGAQFFCFNN